jgi:c-di-GMP-binding flagellar brake protein YcgR
MERRNQYRIELGEKSTVEVSIHVEDRPLMVGRLHDVSAEGAGVVLPNLAGAPLAVGQNAELVLVGRTIVKPLRVSAIVSHHRIEGTGPEAVQRYGFDFTDKEGFDELLIAQDLHVLFNRRRARRIQPDPEEPIEVHLEDEDRGKSESARVVDLSTGGVGIQVTPKAGPRFAEGERVSVSLRLPGGSEDLRLEGKVLHRSEATGGGTRYGIEFDRVRTPRFAEQQALLARYVDRCLRQLLKAGAR